MSIEWKITDVNLGIEASEVVIDTTLAETLQDNPRLYFQFGDDTDILFGDEQRMIYA